jgi:molybdopterin-guanine dinucleotide biosynthesis protein B
MEIFRVDGPHKTPLCIDDPNLVAFVTDSDISPPVPVFTPEEIGPLADFIQSRFIPQGGL